MISLNLIKNSEYNNFTTSQISILTILDCDCYQPGTNNGLVSCTEEGNCNCKTFVDGNKCKSCDDGYYRLAEKNMFGCTGKMIVLVKRQLFITCMTKLEN